MTVGININERWLSCAVFGQNTSVQSTEERNGWEWNGQQNCLMYFRSTAHIKSLTSTGLLLTLFITLLPMKMLAEKWKCDILSGKIIFWDTIRHNAIQMKWQLNSFSIIHFG